MSQEVAPGRIRTSGSPVCEACGDQLRRVSFSFGHQVGGQWRDPAVSRLSRSGTGIWVVRVVVQCSSGTGALPGLCGQFVPLSYPRPDSNRRRCRERAVSLAARRRGQGGRGAMCARFPAGDGYRVQTAYSASTVRGYPICTHGLAGWCWLGWAVDRVALTPPFARSPDRFHVAPSSRDTGSGYGEPSVSRARTGS